MEGALLGLVSRRVVSRSATHIVTPVAIALVLLLNLALFLLPPVVAVLVLAGIIS